MRGKWKLLALLFALCGVILVAVFLLKPRPAITVAFRGYTNDKLRPVHFRTVRSNEWQRKLPRNSPGLDRIKDAAGMDRGREPSGIQSSECTPRRAADRSMAWAWHQLPLAREFRVHRISRLAGETGNAPGT